MQEIFFFVLLLIASYAAAKCPPRHLNVCEKINLDIEDLDSILEHHEPEYECCPGYKGNIENCMPICSESCGLNSYCAFPETCTCNEGYMTHSNGNCVPMIDPHLCGEKIKVFAENSTNSDWSELEGAFKILNLSLPKPYPTSFKTKIRYDCCEGYERKTEDDLCQPKCPEKCESNSFCSMPNVCECDLGYHVALNGQCVKNKIEFQADDPHVCSVKTVKFVNLIDYFKLFSTTAQPERLIRSKLETEHFCCPGYEQQKSGDLCLPKLEDTKPGKCQCEDGFAKNQFDVCEPICTELCPPQSTCIQPEQCQCNVGYANRTTEDDGYICHPECNVDIPDNAYCARPNEWECKIGYIKLPNPNDQFFHCAPHCEPSCFTFSECVAPNICKCLPGYKTSPYMTDSSETRDLCVRIVEETKPQISFRNS